MPYNHMKKISKQPTVHEAISRATARFAAAGIGSDRLDSLVLLEKVLLHNRAWLLANHDTLVSNEHWKQFWSLVNERAKLVPIAYLLGEKEFFGRTFTVSADVLVPRPETEDIIELALALPRKPLEVLDLGTGSGCIGITIALERADWRVTLSDTSQAALNTAKINVSNHGLSKKILLAEQDLLGESKMYNVVIANMPYVPTGMEADPSIKHEPPQALFSGSDGLDHYRRIAEIFAKEPKRKPQDLLTESLEYQHKVIQMLFESVGYQLVARKGLCQHFALGVTA